MKPPAENHSPAPNNTAITIHPEHRRQAHSQPNNSVKSHFPRASLPPRPATHRRPEDSSFSFTSDSGEYQTARARLPAARVLQPAAWARKEMRIYTGRALLYAREAVKVILLSSHPPLGGVGVPARSARQPILRNRRARLSNFQPLRSGGVYIHARVSWLCRAEIKFKPDLVRLLVLFSSGNKRLIDLARYGFFVGMGCCATLFW